LCGTEGVGGVSVELRSAADGFFCGGGGVICLFAIAAGKE